MLLWFITSTAFSYLMRDGSQHGDGGCLARPVMCFCSIYLLQLIIGLPGFADEAQRVFNAITGVEPSLSTWCALLNAFADSRQPNRATQTIQQMRKRKIALNVQVGIPERGRRCVTSSGVG